MPPVAQSLSGLDTHVAFLGYRSALDARADFDRPVEHDLVAAVAYRRVMSSVQELGSLQQLGKVIPRPPRSQRASRYLGDDRAVPLSAMSETDRVGARALYAAITALDRRLGEGAGVADALASFDVDRVLEIARSLGRSDSAPPSDLRRALHDVRGGALASLTLVASQQTRRPDATGERSLRILAADHLKVMRNALLELDDEKRAADRVPCVHYVERLVATLERVASDNAHVRVHCEFSGGITTSCMELGALDRAALNVVNNAVRHATSDTVSAWLAPVEGESSGDLRIVVANAIHAAHADVLSGRFGDDLSRLFTERFTTTGSGDGLGICAELVAAAYGHARIDDAARLGLVGARVVGGEFVAWLHWPIVV